MNKITKRVTTALFVALTFLFMLVGCSEGFGPGADRPADETELSVYQDALAKGDISLANEIRLKYFAKAVAQSLTTPGVGAYLKNEIGKKFDGDYDVLWATVMDQDFPNLGRMRGLVASSLQGMNSIVSLQEIEEVPLLQISLPVGFEEWDGETAIKVAYTPLTINDVDVTEIYAYDSSGEEYILDGQEPPDFPVMVVGINERTDEKGKLLQHFKTSLIKGVEGNATQFSVRSNGDPETLEYVYLDDDREPWTRGSPEIYFITMNPDGFFSRMNRYSEWTGWGTNHSWHTLNDWLFYWSASFGDQYLMWIWEADGSSSNQERTLGVDYSFYNDSRDDDLGARTVYKTDLYRDKPNPYYTADARFTVKWD